MTAEPDLLLVMVGPEMAGRVVAEARRLAPRLPIVGGASLVAPRALAEAGAAADGVRAQVLIPPEPDAGPISSFAARYTAADKEPPTSLALAGYLAVGMVKAGLAKTGSAEPRALAEALGGLSVKVKDQPMLLADCSWNAAGEPDRPSWIVDVRDGKPHGIATLRG